MLYIFPEAISDGETQSTHTSKLFSQIFFEFYIITYKNIYTYTYIWNCCSSLTVDEWICTEYYFFHSQQWCLHCGIRLHCRFFLFVNKHHHKNLSFFRQPPNVLTMLGFLGLIFCTFFPATNIWNKYMNSKFCLFSKDFTISLSQNNHRRFSVNVSFPLPRLGNRYVRFIGEMLQSRRWIATGVLPAIQGRLPPPVPQAGGHGHPGPKGQAPAQVKQWTINLCFNFCNEIYLT